MPRNTWKSVAVVAVLSLLPASDVLAQSPLDACQDQLRGVRVYAERLAKSKQADDLDAAQVIANLIKQIESLQAEMQRMKTSEKPAGSGQPGSGPAKKEGGN